MSENQTVATNNIRTTSLVVTGIIGLIFGVIGFPLAMALLAPFGAFVYNYGSRKKVQESNVSINCMRIGITLSIIGMTFAIVRIVVRFMYG